MRLLGAVLVLAAGCSEARDPPARPRQPGPGLDGAAAHVNGEPIALEEVRRLCAVTGLAPDQALERLVRERLLVQHAQDRGYGERASVRRAAVQASVRALLARAIEAATPAGDVEAQRRQLTRYLSQLAEATTVRYDEPAIREALARDDLLEPAAGRR